AQRCSMTKLRPSTKPASARPRRSAATMCSNDADGVLRRRPTTGTPGCCACAAGQGNEDAAAPPRSVMNSRRLTAQCLRASHERIAHLEWQEFAAAGFHPAYDRLGVKTRIPL